MYSFKTHRYGSNITTSKKALKTKTTKRNGQKKDDAEKSSVTAIVKNAPAAPFPKKLSPMLATLVDEPFKASAVCG
ncbi:MAG: hypothetical protein M9933_17950 [Chitinophagaceae bacterium]|nr:hypothetical protein [Chitinophagaceae bacterium]